MTDTPHFHHRQSLSVLCHIYFMQRTSVRAPVNGARLTGSLCWICHARQSWKWSCSVCTCGRVPICREQKPGDSNRITKHINITLLLAWPHCFFIPFNVNVWYLRLCSVWARLRKKNTQKKSTAKIWCSSTANRLIQNLCLHSKVTIIGNVLDPIRYLRARFQS